MFKSPFSIRFAERAFELAERAINVPMTAVAFVIVVGWLIIKTEREFGNHDPIP